MGRAIRPSQGSRGRVAVVAAAAFLLGFNFYFAFSFFHFEIKAFRGPSRGGFSPSPRRAMLGFSFPFPLRKGQRMSLTPASWSCQCFLLAAARRVRVFGVCSAGRRSEWRKEREGKLEGESAGGWGEVRGRGACS